MSTLPPEKTISGRWRKPVGISAALVGFLGALGAFIGFGGLQIIINFLFVERLVIPNAQSLKGEVSLALNPGTFPLQAGEFVEWEMVPRLQVDWRVSLENGRKRGILDLGYSHFFVNSSFLVAKLQDVLARELKTEKKFFLSLYPADCLLVKVKDEEIAYGEEGFRILKDLFCNVPSQANVVVSSCRLLNQEGVKMQEVLRRLTYYNGHLHESFSPPTQPGGKCKFQWEKQPEVTNALKAFQVAQGIGVDGVFGRNTRAALRRAAEAQNIPLGP